METSYSSRQLGHLGLVSGMIDDLGIVEEINQLLSPLIGGEYCLLAFCARNWF